MNPTASFTAPNQETIAQRARELWESYGRPEGRDTEIWLEAERQLLGVDSRIEAAGDEAISAPALDEAVSHDKPRTRLSKTATTRKAAASDAKLTRSPKDEAPPAKASSSAKSNALSKTGGAKTATKAPSTVRPRR